MLCTLRAGHGPPPACPRRGDTAPLWRDALGACCQAGSATSRCTAQPQARCMAVLARGLTYRGRDRGTARHGAAREGDGCLGATGSCWLWPEVFEGFLFSVVLLVLLCNCLSQGSFLVSELSEHFPPCRTGGSVNLGWVHAHGHMCACARWDPAAPCSVLAAQRTPPSQLPVLDVLPTTLLLPLVSLAWL